MCGRISSSDHAQRTQETLCGHESQPDLVTWQDGWLTRKGYLARWRHLVAKDTPAALAGLLYLGYKPEGELGVLFSVSKPRRAERKDNALSRSLVQARLPEYHESVSRDVSVVGSGLWRALLWCAALPCAGMPVESDSVDVSVSFVQTVAAVCKWSGVIGSARVGLLPCTR